MTKGLKTPAFWLGALATATAAALGSGALDGGNVAAGLALVGSSLGAAGYTAWRAFAKAEEGKKKPWKTSEFWLTLVTALVGGFYTFEVFAADSVAFKVLGVITMGLSFLGYTVPKTGKPSAPKV